MQQPQLTIDNVEVAVLQDKQDLAILRAARQPELPLARVPHQVSASQTGVHVVAGAVHGVVVIPEELPDLAQPEVEIVVAVGVGGELVGAGGSHVVRPSVVVRGRMRPVQVHRRPADRCTGGALRCTALPAEVVLHRVGVPIGVLQHGGGDGKPGRRLHRIPGTDRRRQEVTPAHPRLLTSRRLQ
ncbi:MAG TPA: hypothetical protein VGO16_00925 [Pseudonocardiaceae bacterium]|nr:hypothetical protein [Pseudonocardiaceae bacterium]